ncbi:hypothetical protein PAXRUDRAFT_171120 [Paxillus rubicundulus Ve08.2h10]|uniref:Uncharacterized protein n=1 Tax=Paxillus rubicundulus Ve08.2h10 TaxID=930991 RepID=A0A0D0D720_9AGAM|nr:hypothetical protein PAXRUDRAFT_171120 [Paxillus rubicundulus Ve08.2h10]
MYFETGASYLPTQQGKNVPQEVVPPVAWHIAQSASIQQPGTTYSGTESLFYKAKTFTTTDGDNVHINVHVIWQSDQNPVELSIGKIAEILIPAGSHCTSHVVIMQLEFLPELHPELHTPRLKLSEPEKKSSPQAQHTCSLFSGYSN